MRISKEQVSISSYERSQVPCSRWMILTKHNMEKNQEKAKQYEDTNSYKKHWVKHIRNPHRKGFYLQNSIQRRMRMRWPLRRHSCRSPRVVPLFATGRLGSRSPRTTGTSTALCKNKKISWIFRKERNGGLSEIDPNIRLQPCVI